MAAMTIKGLLEKLPVDSPATELVKRALPADEQQKTGKGAGYVEGSTLLVQAAGLLHGNEELARAHLRGALTLLNLQLREVSREHSDSDSRGRRSIAPYLHERIARIANELGDDTLVKAHSDLAEECWRAERSRVGGLLELPRQDQDQINALRSYNAVIGERLQHLPELVRRAAP